MGQTDKCKYLDMINCAEKNVFKKKAGYGLAICQYKKNNYSELLQNNKLEFL